MFPKSAADEHDDFVKAFNDPYGEEETRREKFADFRANADKRVWDDDFLIGLDDPYGEKETERREKFAEMRANVDKRDWNEDGTLYPRFEASSKAHEALHPHYVASGKGKVLDGISTALTAASFVPGLDTFTNIAQIPVDLLRGDYISAGLDLIGAIPLVGEIADGAKTVRTADRIIDGGKALVKAADVADDAVDVTKAVGKNLAQNSDEIAGLSKTLEVSDDVADFEKTLESAERLDISSFPMEIHQGNFGKHKVGHNNYIEGRSIVEISEEETLDLLKSYAGKGQKINTNCERVDFGINIGKYVDGETGKMYDTTVATVRYSKNGIHIVPARPNRWKGVK